MNRELFFKTPEDKSRVFEKPRLLLISNGIEAEGWENTQPLYLYPFSWLDYLNPPYKKELHLLNCHNELAKDEIDKLRNGKIHFENADIHLIEYAKEKGNRVSVICNLEDLSDETIQRLGESDFIRVRINKKTNSLSKLSSLPRDGLLSGIKLYIGEGCDYHTLTLQARDMGIDFVSISKRLIQGDLNLPLLKEEKEEILNLKSLETRSFKVIVPSSLDEVYARRFLISSEFGNSNGCNFSRYRIVLKGDRFYPCYTQELLSQTGSISPLVPRSRENCSDCACIYENDFLSDIEDKKRKYKNPVFALEYIKNGK